MATKPPWRLIGTAVLAGGVVGMIASSAFASGTSFRAKATGYFPFNDLMEGGFHDRRGRPLRTLQDYIANGHSLGDGDYVSVAMDPNAFPYGTVLESPEVNTHYGRRVEFRVVDTGGAFYGKGTSRIDICNKTRADTLAPLTNSTLTFHVVKR